MREIALTQSVDQKQVARALIVLLFEVKGPLDYPAQNDGRTYSASDLARAREMCVRGERLDKIAKAIGRTPLGIGWRLIDESVPRVPDAVTLARRVGA